MFVVLNQGIGVVGIVSYKEIQAAGLLKVEIESYLPFPVSNALYLVHSAPYGVLKSHGAG